MIAAARSRVRNEPVLFLCQEGAGAACKKSCPSRDRVGVCGAAGREQGGGEGPCPGATRAALLYSPAMTLTNRSRSLLGALATAAFLVSTTSVPAFAADSREGRSDCRAYTHQQISSSTVGGSATGHSWLKSGFYYPGGQWSTPGYHQSSRGSLGVSTWAASTNGSFSSASWGCSNRPGGA